MTQAHFEIVYGLPKGKEAEAAALYWQAFGGKLGKLLGPSKRAIHFFTQTVHPPSVIAAIAADGRLLGIAAVKLDGKGFSNSGLAPLFRHYGIGTVWRLIPLLMLERSPPADTLQMDGICVDANARGMGVGSALLDAVSLCACQNGLQKVTLDVIDTNPRAKVLYQRKGFVAVSQETTSVLKPLLGFNFATRMVKDAGV